MVRQRVLLRVDFDREVIQCCERCCCIAAEVDEHEMTFLCAEDSVMLEKLHKKVRVIKEISLPINLHDFFATFVDDGAPHSYQRYVETTP